MFIIKGSYDYSYEIRKTTNIFDPDNDTLLTIGGTEPRGRRFIIIDSIVNTLYGECLKHYFASNGIATKICEVPGGDLNKNEEYYRFIFNELCSFDSMRKSEPLLAIGGGVITDIGGFVASTYRRGIPHIKVPTTLIGYVDASVGIKTGVNFGPYKNRMGSFEIPAGVILDKSLLKTLDKRNIINGIGEIIKLAIILDPVLFDLLEKSGSTLINDKFQSEVGEIILDRSIQNMINELSGNFYETTLKRKVDFGHTFSLMIESASNYETKHGEAVGIDVLYSCCLAFARGLLKEHELNKIFNLYHTLGLPIWSPYLNTTNLWAGVLERTMHRDGQQLIPVPTGIGCCTFINDLTKEEVQFAINILQNHPRVSAVKTINNHYCARDLKHSRRSTEPISDHLP